MYFVRHPYGRIVYEIKLFINIWVKYQCFALLEGDLIESVVSGGETIARGVMAILHLRRQITTMNQLLYLYYIRYKICTNKKLNKERQKM